MNVNNVDTPGEMIYDLLPLLEGKKGLNRLNVTNNYIMKKCQHNWKRIYYRKKVKNKSYQIWKTIPNKFICDKCLKIRGLK